MANEIARKLRKTMTRQEVKLWVRLREFRALGHHFCRQSPILTYIVDFECRRSRLIVEIDGTQHGFDANRERDLARDESLRRAGYKVLRFANPEIDRELDAVMETIFAELTSADPTRLLAARGATLPSGEG
jgi:very-short-patch-repair endonuclease